MLGGKLKHATSPTPKQVQEVAPDLSKLTAKAPMNFFDALKEVAAGRKIANVDWDEGWYGFMRKEKLTLHNPDGTLNLWTVSGADMEAEEWVVVK